MIRKKGSFLGRLNRLSDSGSGKLAQDIEALKRELLDRLKERAEPLVLLLKLADPDLIADALLDLEKMGMVQALSRTEERIAMDQALEDETSSVSLTDYARKALTYLTPA